MEVNLQLFIDAKDDGCGDENWSYKLCKTPIKSSPPTNQNRIFRSRIPFLSPTQSVEARTTNVCHCYSLTNKRTPLTSSLWSQMYILQNSCWRLIFNARSGSTVGNRQWTCSQLHDNENLCFFYIQTIRGQWKAGEVISWSGNTCQPLIQGQSAFGVFNRQSPPLRVSGAEPPDVQHVLLTVEKFFADIQLVKSCIHSIIRSVISVVISSLEPLQRTYTVS